MFLTRNQCYHLRGFIQIIWWAAKQRPNPGTWLSDPSALSERTTLRTTPVQMTIQLFSGMFHNGIQKIETFWAYKGKRWSKVRNFLVKNFHHLSIKSGYTWIPLQKTLKSLYNYWTLLHLILQCRVFLNMNLLCKYIIQCIKNNEKPPIISLP